MESLNRSDSSLCLHSGFDEPGAKIAHFTLSHPQYILPSPSLDRHDGPAVRIGYLLDPLFKKRKAG